MMYWRRVIKDSAQQAQIGRHVDKKMATDLAIKSKLN